MQVELSRKNCVKQRLVTYIGSEQLNNNSMPHELLCEGNEQGAVIDNRLEGDQKGWLSKN